MKQRTKKRPAKRFAPKQVNSARALAELQRAMWTLISRPLTAANRMPRRWKDGRPTAELAAQIAKPNDRLTSFERLEIYSRMYWFRVLDSLYEDCPGLRAVLGQPRFMKLIEAYLVKYPSRSFTLRNLPSRLARFIREEPSWTQPYTALCYDLACFEWARIEVFDSAALPVFTLNDLLTADPAKLKLNLQPYLQLLQLDYPVDEFILAVKQRDELSRSDSSNTALTKTARKPISRKVARPNPEPTHVAVHRMDSTIYFKRLDPAAHRILRAIQRGKTLAQALAAGLSGTKKSGEDLAGKIQDWFRTWMELGWFCQR